MIQTQRFVQDLKDEIQYEKKYKYQVPFENSEYYKTLTQRMGNEKKIMDEAYVQCAHK